MRLDLSLQQQLVQAVHAAHEAGIHYGDPENIHSVVVCQVQNETHLLFEKERLEACGLKTVLFREPDIENQATALGTELITQEQRKYFNKLKLWRQ